MSDPAIVGSGTQPQERGVRERGTPFTTEKADAVRHRTAGPAAAPRYPQVHERVLKDLMAVARRHPVDGPQRLPEVLSVATGVPTEERAPLHARLSDDRRGDAFAVYVSRTFPQTRRAFLDALVSTAGASAGSAPPAPSGRAKPAGFLTDRYADVASDPMYLDNFTNTVADAWYPNDRVFVLEYPGGVALLLAHRDLLRALNIASELTPPPTEEELRRRYRIPADLELPRSTSPSGRIVVGNQVTFHRDAETGIIYPTPGPIPHRLLPRLSRAVRETEAARPDQELMARAAPKILERITSMEWGVFRGLGPFFARIGRRLRRGAKAAGEVMKKGLPARGTRANVDRRALGISGEPPAVRLYKFGDPDCLHARVETGGGESLYRVTAIAATGPRAASVKAAHREMMVATALEAKRLGQAEFRMVGDQVLPGSEFPKHVERLVQAGIAVAGSAKRIGLGMEVKLSTAAVLWSNGL